MAYRKTKYNSEYMDIKTSYIRRTLDEIFWKVSMKYQAEFRKEYFEKLKKEGYELNGQIFVQIEKDIYIEWLEAKLQNTSSNSDYVKLPKYIDIANISGVRPSDIKKVCDAIKQLSKHRLFAERYVNNL